MNKLTIIEIVFRFSSYRLVVYICLFILHIITPLAVYKVEMYKKARACDPVLLAGGGQDTNKANQTGQLNNVPTR